MSKHEVKCRICKQIFDTNKLKENEEWIMPSKNFYYHTKCYNEWQSNKDNIETTMADNSLWQDAAYQYLKKDLKILVDWNKFNSQWKNLLKKGRTSKGIYFCIRYFYELEKGDPSKAQGGIGIVDYVYNRSAEYWIKREQKSSGLLAEIEKQLKERAEREKMIIKRTNNKRKKTNKNTLEMVEELE